MRSALVSKPQGFVAGSPRAMSVRLPRGDTGRGGDHATQGDTRTYAEVIDSYPANAEIVDFEARFDEVAIYGENEGWSSSRSPSVIASDFRRHASSLSAPQCQKPSLLSPSKGGRKSCSWWPARGTWRGRRKRFLRSVQSASREPSTISRNPLILASRLST